MSIYKIALSIMLGLLLFCGAVGVVSADATDNVVADTWVNATNGVAYTGYNSSSITLPAATVVDASNNVHNDTAAAYFVVSITSVLDGTDATFTLPSSQTAGSSVKVKETGNGTEIAMPTSYDEIAYGDGASVTNVPWGAGTLDHTYRDGGDWTPSATLLGCGCFDETPALVAFTPATLQVVIPSGMEFVLSAGPEFTEKDDKYYLSPGMSANISVSLKYNLSNMTDLGFDPTESYTMTGTNFTAVTNFSSVGNNMTGSYVLPAGASNTTSGTLVDQTLKVGYTIIAGFTLSGATENEVAIGNISITAPVSWEGNWTNLETPLSVSINDAYKALLEGVLIANPDDIDGDDVDCYSVDASNVFDFYALDEEAELYSIKYFDGRYTYEQPLTAGDENGPTFYLYNDIFDGSFAGSENGTFTLNLTGGSTLLIDGYTWNTDNFGDNFRLQHVFTAGANNLTNSIDKPTYFNEAGPAVMNVSIRKGGEDVSASVRNVTIKVENYLTSSTNNSLSKVSEGGWFFNETYAATMNVRPGPVDYEGSGWDSGIAYPEFKNLHATSAYSWSADFTSGNTNTTFANDSGKVTGGQNIFVLSSVDDGSGADAVIALTGTYLGDVNKNGKVNLIDSSRLAYIIGSADEGNDYAHILADKAYNNIAVNHLILLDCNQQGGDGQINVADLRELNAWLTYVNNGMVGEFDVSGWELP